MKRQVRTPGLSPAAGSGRPSPSSATPKARSARRLCKCRVDKLEEGLDQRLHPTAPLLPPPVTSRVILWTDANP